MKTKHKNPLDMNTIEIVRHLQSLLSTAFFDKYVNTMNSIEYVKYKLEESKEFFQKKAIEDELVRSIYEHQVITTAMNFIGRLNRLENLLVSGDDTSVMLASQYHRHLVEYSLFMMQFKELEEMFDLIDRSTPENIQLRIDIINALTIFISTKN